MAKDREHLGNGVDISQTIQRVASGLGVDILCLVKTGEKRDACLSIRVRDRY